jgi:hypothetical protein
VQSSNAGADGQADRGPDQSADEGPDGRSDEGGDATSDQGPHQAADDWTYGGADDPAVTYFPASDFDLCRACRAIYHTAYVAHVYPNRCAACGVKLARGGISVRRADDDRLPRLDDTDAGWRRAQRAAFRTLGPAASE